MKAINKVIVVTGAGNGIGRELVLRLAAKGAKIAAVDYREQTLNETVALAGKEVSVVPFVLDVSDRKAVEALPSKVVDAFGHVDGLINNAGIIQPFVRFADLNWDDAEHVMNVNLYGLLYMTRAFIPYLLARPEAHIVNISSMGGFLPVPGQTIYGASKAAVKLFTEGLRAELADTSVHVTVIFPGAIQTNITANSGVTIPGQSDAAAKYKSLPAEKAAEMIIDAMEHDRYRALVGSDAKFMDRIYRLNPEYAAKFIYRQMKELLSK